MSHCKTIDDVNELAISIGISAEELEDVMVELSRKGITAAQAGEQLRDTYLALIKKGNKGK